MQSRSARSAGHERSVIRSPRHRRRAGYVAANLCPSYVTHALACSARWRPEHSFQVNSIQMLRAFLNLERWARLPWPTVLASIELRTSSVHRKAHKPTPRSTRRRLAPRRRPALPFRASVCPHGAMSQTQMHSVRLHTTHNVAAHHHVGRSRLSSSFGGALIRTVSNLVSPWAWVSSVFLSVTTKLTKCNLAGTPRRCASAPQALLSGTRA